MQTENTTSVTSPTQTHTILLYSKAQNPTIFNNGRYTTNIPRDPHTVTTTDIKTNMRHVHASILFGHLATRGNNKILCTLHHTLAALKRDLTASLIAPLPNSEQTNLPSSNCTYTKSTPKHIHHHYAPYVTSTHTTHIISSTAPTYAPHCNPWIYGQTRRSDCTAGQMDGEVGWWTTSGKIGLPPLARVTEVGRQQQQPLMLMKQH